MAVGARMATDSLFEPSSFVCFLTISSHIFTYYKIISKIILKISISRMKEIKNRFCVFYIFFVKVYKTYM